MEYLMTFLTGIISFISPCMLPMLPLYISYFSDAAHKKSKIFLLALSFVAGFSAVFSLLGIFMGSLGALFSRFHGTVDLICGIIIILLGLQFLGIIRLPMAHGEHHSHAITGTLSAFFFGVAFSVGHAPCVGAFLGTALVTAGASGSLWEGLLLMLCYSLGLGLPFLASAVLIEKLTLTFSALTKRAKAINLICGIFLILLGISMATGLFHILLHPAA